MANSRNYTKGWLVNDRFAELTPEGQGTLLVVLDKADDIGFIPNPKATLRAQNIPSKTLEELVKNNYLIKAPSEDNDLYLFKEWSEHQRLRHFLLSGISNPFLIPNLFVDEKGQTVFKDNTDTNNVDFIDSHRLLIENVYQKSANFKQDLLPWIKMNKNIISDVVMGRLTKLITLQAPNAIEDTKTEV
ncbi:hypothetical protein [Oenococcus oeni]|uniref:Uncharacterized protein n=1 Tax=Oenococcus oeni TaxID=1247 RepID=A0A6N4A1G3_OENOE|nr:hypothetical protein [Oenococcus oeni]KGH77735.1 hypothetical protein X285_04280 [Oenococcus oeni IOEB_9304]KGH88227.1 hypothetical protein X292_00210 [Oenococcus oeni IOEB_C28]EKP89525.1 putative phage protein [Oenococcus oeni DSM 20252 = AWRIB129]KGH53517.1 hypothetical protein X299_06135 [Oenococcus oeni IOEB_S277]KGH59367.1 hypothetical protein X288_04325 [Oenococcus oeni IOEB_9805]